MIFFLTVYLMVGAGISATILDGVIDYLINLDSTKYTNNFSLKLFVVSLIVFFWPIIFMSGRN